MRFFRGRIRKKLHLASGHPVKVRHIPANLFSQVDDMASRRALKVSFQGYFIVECTQNF